MIVGHLGWYFTLETNYFFEVGSLRNVELVQKSLKPSYKGMHLQLCCCLHALKFESSVGLSGTILRKHINSQREKGRKKNLWKYMGIAYNDEESFGTCNCHIEPLGIGEEP